MKIYKEYEKNVSIKFIPVEEFKSTTKTEKEKGKKIVCRTIKDLYLFGTESDLILDMADGCFVTHFAYVDDIIKQLEEKDNIEKYEEIKPKEVIKEGVI